MLKFQAENPRKMTPRICALKFQNGTNNIVLDSPQGEAKMYTRRPRLLDDLLDDEKDITGNVPMNFESSKSSMVLSTASNQSKNHEIFSTNKTDSEKFNEIQSKDVLVPLEDSNQVVVVKERELTINHGKVARSTEIFCDSVSSEIDVNDSILLRRQQLTRVAEWVQNSSNIPLPNSPMQTLDNLSVSNDYENNNSTLLAPLNQMYKESSENNAQNNLTKKLNESNNLSIKSDDLVGDGKIDLAQMEYNVKKFLLKQNEWHHSISGESYAASKSECEEETIFKNKSTEKLTSSFLVQRTETNL